MSKIGELVHVINEDTGEILTTFHSKKATSKKVIKYEIDDMLKSAKTQKDLNSSLLYHWCQIIQAINQKGQIQTFGNKLHDDLENVLINEGVLFAHVYKCIKLAHPFTHILKKNHISHIQTWNDLWNEIGCGDRRMQQRIKKFLEENKLIKAFPIKKVNGETKNLFVLNPYLYKNASHAGQFACIVWQECAKPNININFYAYMWLVSQDCIPFEEEIDYNEIVENFFVNKAKKMKK